ncbi:hypothetical protein D3C71_1902910 [compost metagenome]
MAHQHLAVLQCGNVDSHLPEVAFAGFALGAVIEKNLLIRGHERSPCDNCNAMESVRSAGLPGAQAPALSGAGSRRLSLKVPDALQHSRPWAS